MTWTFDTSDETYKLGDSLCGCGVFFDNEQWMANICYYKEIHNIGPFINRHSAMLSAEDYFHQIKQEYS